MKNILFRVFLMLLMGFIPVGLTLAQSASDQLTTLVTQLQSSPDDQDLKMKIIALGHKAKPAKPEDFERFTARGKTAMEEAKEPKDFDAAVTEFQKAVLAAPWLGIGYFNLGVAQEKAGHFKKALDDFRLYLVASPKAADAAKVKTKIYSLEYKQEKQGSLDGVWAVTNGNGTPFFTITDGAEKISVTPGDNNQYEVTKYLVDPQNKQHFTLQITDINHRPANYVYDMTLDEDGKTLSGMETLTQDNGNVVAPWDIKLYRKK